uniref:GOLD domain-containing protein n=1 Tax=Fundulus heteroclitus TaxID=8078 RepID=A0A3Q2P215_FUNHE
RAGATAGPIICRVAFLLQCSLTLAAAMYFDLGEQEEKCIIEEIPEDTLVTGLEMSHWVCCNSCFLSQSPERKLAVTSCGHVVCSSAFSVLCHHYSSTQTFTSAAEKEELFRQISEETNSKVLWWAVVQTFTLLSVGFWQMKRLKDFFIAKKLV